MLYFPTLVCRIRSPKVIGVNQQAAWKSLLVYAIQFSQSTRQDESFHYVTELRFAHAQCECGVLQLIK
jgi:hypothetical protein